MVLKSILKQSSFSISVNSGRIFTSVSKNIILFIICFFYNIIHSVIENDHMGDWSPDKACCWRLMLQQNIC